MEEEIKKIHSELLNIQSDRMRIINEDNARFVKLEKSLSELLAADNAQINLNRALNLRISELEAEVKSLEIRLNNLKPLITVQPTGTPFRLQAPSAIPNNKWFNWF